MRNTQDNNISDAVKFIIFVIVKCVTNLIYFSSVHPTMHYAVNNTLKLFVQFSWTMLDAFSLGISQPATYHPFFIAHDHHILLCEILNFSTFKCSLCL